MKFVVRRRIAEMSILSFCKIMGWGTRMHLIGASRHLPRALKLILFVVRHLRLRNLDLLVSLDSRAFHSLDAKSSLKGTNDSP